MDEKRLSSLLVAAVPVMLSYRCAKKEERQEEGPVARVELKLIRYDGRHESV